MTDAFIDAAHCTKNCHGIPSWCLAGVKCVPVRPNRKDLGNTADSIGSPVCSNQVGVNAATGNVFVAETDEESENLTFTGFARSYNSQLAASATDVDTGMGNGWRSSFDRRIWPVSVHEMILFRPDGQEQIWRQGIDGWQGLAGQLVKLPGQAAGWEFTDISRNKEQYSADGLLQKLTSHSGRISTLVYDKNNNINRLKMVSDQTGRKLEFYYNQQGNLARMTDSAVGTYQYAYDYRKNLVESTKPDGSIRSYAYTDEVNPAALTSITDEDGHIIQAWRYDDQGRVSSGFFGMSINSFVYAADGTSTQVTDGLNRTRTISMANTAVGYRITGSSAPCNICGYGSARAIIYDANGNMISRTDFNGNATSKTVTDTNSGTVRSWNYSYTTSADGTLPNLLKSATDPRGNITRYTYYANGDLKTITNPLGQATVITQYDANGHPLAQTDPNGLKTSFNWNSRGWLTSNTIGGLTTQYGYDQVGNLTQVTYPSGASYTYAYDAAHHLIAITDNLGNKINYGLDALGNRIAENAYDSHNNLLITHSRQYNRLNQLIADIGAINSETMVYRYDANSNLIQHTDPLQHATAWIHDQLNRVTSSTDATGKIARYGYNALDQQTSTTDPRGLTTSYGIDALDNLNKLDSPDSGTTTNTYDTAGNLASSTDARGLSTTWAYDALNRVISKAYGSTMVTYTYDQGQNAIGHLTGMADAAGNTRFSYDSHERLQQVTQTVRRTVSVVKYAYDEQGRLATLTYPSGLVKTLGYNVQGQVASIAINGTAAISNIQYFPFGGIKSWLWANGQRYARTMDGDGRLMSYPLGSADTRSLSWDAASRITGMLDSQPTQTQRLTYDNLDRLTSWVSPSASQSYTYDADGNRTGITIGAAPTTYSYPATSNRLASTVGGAPNNYAWDAAGHLLSENGQHFTWDDSGRMASSTTDSATTHYDVNGLG